MDEEDIPRECWQAFCDAFSRQHHGWLVGVSVIETPLLEADAAAADARARVLVKDMVLQGITVARKGGSFELTIHAGQQAQHVTHAVSDPLRLRLEQDSRGAHKGLRIDAVQGETTMLRFRATALPESLDGMAGTEW